MAFKDQAVSMGLDFLGGALSGGFGGGGAVAVTSSANTTANARAVASIGKTLQESGQYNALLNEVLKLNKNSDAYQLASKLQSGKMKATAKNIGNLFTRYVRAGSDIGSFVAAAAAQRETNTIGETLSAMDSQTLALFAHLLNASSSQSVLSELNQGKRPSNELLKQFADETGLAKRALDVSQAFQSEQSALSDLRQAQARYRSENTTQAQTALSDAQSAYVSAVGKLNTVAKGIGINSAEGMQRLRNALGGTEVATLPDSTGAVNSPVQIAGYGEEAPSGLTLPGAELFAQENAAYSGNEVPTLTLPGAELFAQENTLNTPVDTSPQNGNMGVGSANNEGTDDVLNRAGIPKVKVDEILKTPKYSRPDPRTYLSNEQITKHEAQFKNGVTKISIKAPSGYAGPPGGTFVMPISVADDLIARANGDISELERLLGLDPGDLGTNPVRIDIMNPTGLRMPSGNEKGASPKWIPGGFTSGGISEAIIDSPKPGQYTVTPIK